VYGFICCTTFEGFYKNYYRLSSAQLKKENEETSRKKKGPLQLFFSVENVFHIRWILAFARSASTY
jgi:hypothetical protein